MREREGRRGGGEERKNFVLWKVWFFICMKCSLFQTPTIELNYKK